MTAATSREGIADIIGHEAIVPFRYRDSVGVDTCFIGHTAAAGPPDPRTIAFGVERSIEEAMEVFRRDLRKYERRVDRAVTVPIAVHERDALTGFDLNTGRIHDCTLVKKLNAGDRDGAIAEFDKWHRPPEVTRRRDEEKRLFATGQYASGGMANVYPADSRGGILWSQGKRINVMPAVDEILRANGRDDVADRNRNRAVGAGIGSAAPAGGSQAVPDNDAADALPQAVDPAMIKFVLIAIAIGLVVIAALFVFRSIGARREAKRIGANAAQRMTDAIEAGRPIPEDEPPPAFLGKGAAP